MKPRWQRAFMAFRWSFVLGFVVLFSLLGVLYALAKSSVWFQPPGIQPNSDTVTILKTDDQGQPSKMLWREVEGLRGLSGVSGLWPYGVFQRRVIAPQGTQSRESVAVVDWPLLQELRVSLSEGRLPTASEKHAVVISEDFKKRYFGSQQRVIGRFVQFEGGVNLPVAAVLSDDFQGLAHDRPAIVMTQAADLQLEATRADLDDGPMDAKFFRMIRQNTPSYFAFGTLHDKAALAPVQKQLNAGYQPQSVISQKTGEYAVVIDLGQAGSRYRALAGIESAPSLRQHITRLLGLLLLTAVLLAVIVLGNYALHRLAELETGRKELGIHVLAGATRKHLFGLQWRRTLPTIGLAALLALPLTDWLAEKAASLPPFKDYFAGLFVPDMGAFFSLVLLALLLAGSSSLWLTRLAIRKTDGRQNVQLDSASGQRVNTVLAIVQLALAALMLGLTINAAWGFLKAHRPAVSLDVSGLYYLSMSNSDDQWVPDRELSSWLDAIAAQPDLQAVLARVGPYAKFGQVQVVRTADRKTPGQSNPVDVGFFSLVGLKPMAGSLPEHVVEGEAVINQAMAKALFGEPFRAIGQSVTVEGAKAGEYRVTAVVPDIPYGDSLQPLRPMIYPINKEPEYGPSTVLIHAAGTAPEDVRKRLQALAEQFNLKVGKWLPASDAKKDSLRLARAGLLASAGLAVLLVALILVGIWAFTRTLMMQWRKKLAVRTAMGATRRDLTRFALGFALRIVSAAGTLAGVLMALLRPWLPPLLRNTGSPLVFLAVGTGVVSSVFLAVILWQVYRQTRRSAWTELRGD